MSFKIADGYVEVTARVNEKDFRRAARDAAGGAGDDAGSMFSARFNRQAASGADKGGDSSGRRFGDRFNRAAMGRVGSFLGQWRTAFARLVPTNLITFVPILASLAVAAAGATSALVGLVASLGQGLTTIAAIVPLAVALGAAFFVLKSAFKGGITTGPLKEFKERLEGLGERAAKYVKPAFDEFFGAVNDHFFLLNYLIRRTGTEFARFSGTIAQAFEERGLKGTLFDLFQHATQGFGHIAAAVASLIETIILLGAASGPVFVRFAQWLEGLTAGWVAWLTEAYKTGELTAFFAQAADEMSKWGQIVWNFISGLVGIFAGAYSEGTKLADALLRISEAFKAWAWDENTHGKIADLLRRMAEFDYGRFFQMAAAITAIGFALKGVMGISSMVQGLAALMSLGPVAGVLSGIAIAIGLIVGAFALGYTKVDEFRTAVQQLWEWLTATFEPLIQAFGEGFQKGFTDAMTVAADLIRDYLLPALETLFDTLELAAEPIGGLEGAMRLFGEAMAWVFAGPLLILIGGLVTMAAQFTILAHGLMLLREIVTTTFEAISTAIGFAIISIIGYVQDLMNSWFSAFEAILNVAISVASAIAPGMVPGLTAARDKVRGFRDQANTAMNQIKTEIRTKFYAETARATQAINNLKRLLSSVPRTMRTTHYVTSLYRQEQAQANRRNRTGGIMGAGSKGGGPRRHVGGGPGGGMSLVGESGPELVRLPYGASVHTAGDTARKLARDGGGDVRITVDFTGAEDAFTRWLARTIRVDGAETFGLAGSNG